MVDISNIKDEILSVPHQSDVRIHTPKVSVFKEDKVMLNQCLTTASAKYRTGRGFASKVDLVKSQCMHPH